ncbi:hypothetical protein JCM19992_19170 [Thermostilla marina]
MPETEGAKGAIGAVLANLRQAPRRVYRSMFRTGLPKTDRSRSEFVFGNVFLHIHSVRCHRWSLRWATTWGLGLAATSAFLISLVTGILLMVYYKPYPGVAYDSIKDIHYVVPVGRLMRNIHRWAANVMVVTVLAHMARVFYTAAYRSPREFNWLVGLGLLALTVALAFTGYLLPWDQLAYWAITIGTNIAQSPRELTDGLGITSWLDIGGLLRHLLLGSDEIGADALIRFYVLHVIVLPLALVVLLAVHFWRIRKDGGLTRPADVDQRLKPLKNVSPVFTQTPQKTYHLAAVVRGRTPAVGTGPENTLPSMPHLFYAELAVLMLTMLICVALSMVADAPLKELADPQQPENPAKAPWYFLGLQELVSYSAFMGGIGIPTIVLIGLALIPYLDREQEGTGLWLSGPAGWRQLIEGLVVGLGLAVGIEALAIRFGWLRDWFPQVPQLLITAFNPGTLLALAYAVYSLWVIRRTSSIRAGALALFTCFLCGFVILTIIGVHFRGPNWEFYWSPAHWPGH